MHTENKTRSGLILVELVTAMFILGLMMAVLAISLSGYAKFNDYLMVRQRCVAAADAQLDSIAVTGAAISDDDLRRLWPNVKISVEQSDGQGQWKGLKLIKVKAEGKSRRKMVTVELSRYVAAQQEQQK
jgi:hypothetical protein